MDAVINAVFHHRNVPPFVATRLIRALVTSNPSPAYIRRVADAFVDNGVGVRGDLKAVFAAVLLDREALNFAAAHDGRLKDPVLHVIGLGRALEATFGDPHGFMHVFNNLSQRVLTPPTVFSFFSPLAPLPGHQSLFGPEFQIYPPAFAVQRANFIYGLINGQFRSSFHVDLTPYTEAAVDTDTLVDFVDYRLMFGLMSPELRSILTNATNAIEGTSSGDVKHRALGALYLAAISSEYSVHGGNRGSGGGGAGISTAQPPTGLVASSIVGNRVTLKWTAPMLGPAPTGYLIEGGVNPGETLAAIPTGSATPTISFDIPAGRWAPARIRSKFVAVNACGSSATSTPTTVVVPWRQENPCRIHTRLNVATFSN